MSLAWPDVQIGLLSAAPVTMVYCVSADHRKSSHRVIPVACHADGTDACPIWYGLPMFPMRSVQAGLQRFVEDMQQFRDRIAYIGDKRAALI